MALQNVFREIAIEQATKQTTLVNNLLEEAPIVGAMPSEPATHGLHNVYEEITSVTGASQVDVDGELGDVDATTELKQTDLSILGGVIFVGEDKARKFGGAAAYFGKKMPLILRKTGEDLEKAVIYNNLRAYAIAQSKASSAGGSGSANYSILAVTWTPGELTGLYDPNGLGNGTMFDIEALNGGDLYERTMTVDGVSKKIVGYGARVKSYLGIQLANPRYISTLVNIDLDNATPKPPTAAMMDKLLLDCRQNTSTVLYMHPRVLTYLYTYKDARLQMNTAQNDVNRVVAFWNGTPIISSYNFTNGTEATVSL